VDIASVNVTGLDGGIGDSVTVNVTGSVLDIQIPFVGSWPIQLQSEASMRIEQTD
jgi:hypothetical protein